MDNKKIKYFTKFDDSIHKERILAKLMKYNYKILLAKIKNNNQEAKNLEIKRDELYNKAILKSKEYVHYCKVVVRELLSENSELRKTLNNENNQKIKENQDVIKFYKYQCRYYNKDFSNLLKASISCVKNGEVVPFEKLSDEIKENITFENAFDVICNLQPFNVLGFDLADINYRCKVLMHNMPIFMTKKEFDLFEQASIKAYGKIVRDPEITDMAIISNVYDKDFVMNKEQYENVFPEFNFKYEDRESDTMDVYTIDFANIYD